MHPESIVIGMAQASSADRAWIATELVKGIEAERSLAADARSRADSPPDPALSVLYHEIAAADERHATIVEAIAVRYGHTPSNSGGGGISQALGHLKDKIVGLGSNTSDQMCLDVTAKAQSVHWHAAWIHAFNAIGDTASAAELSAVLAEEQAHRDALQSGLNRMVERGARGGGDSPG
jgi:hypothetical protein